MANVPLSSKNVGDIILIYESGWEAEYIIVHKGNPMPGYYDAGFDNSVTLLRKESATQRQWNNSSYIVNYGSSSINSWLNNDFIGLLEEWVQRQIKQVRIPYRTGSSGLGVSSGTNGLLCKAFLPSMVEIGLPQSVVLDSHGLINSIPPEGAKFDYFIEGVENEANEKRAMGDGQAWGWYLWWTRTPEANANSSVWALYHNGFPTDSIGIPNVPNIDVRPAIVFPETLLIDEYDYIFVPEPPTAPDTITVPDPAIGGSYPTISWGTSTSQDGTVLGYILERSVDGEDFTQIYKGVNRSFADTIQNTWETVQWHVRAYDNFSLESEETWSDTVYVIASNPPIISGSDMNLGLKTGGFTQNYTVTNPDAPGLTKILTVIEKINGVVKRTFTAISGAANTFEVTASEWLEVLNGVSTITITATDNFSGQSVRTFTFSKNITEIEIVLTTPLETDSIVARTILNITREIPTNAIFSVEVCNNGFDTTPTWEDVTAAVLAGTKFILTNTVKTAANWGFNIRVKVDRNSTLGDCFIKGIGGNFE